MPTSAEPIFALVDTSVAVALVLEDHEHHAATTSALDGRRLGLAGHAAFETFSVLTRLPAPARRSADVVSQILTANFPETRHLSAERCARLFEELGARSITGGSVYDALVGATAAEHGVVLITRDRRALDIYRAVDATVELLRTAPN
jgi:predicted nucleic acid-binding protein